MKNKKMVALAVLSALALTACGEKNELPDITNPSNKPSHEISSSSSSFDTTSSSSSSSSSSINSSSISSSSSVNSSSSSSTNSSINSSSSSIDSSTTSSIENSSSSVITPVEKPDFEIKPEIEIKDIDVTGMTELDMPLKKKVYNTTYVSDPTTFAPCATSSIFNQKHIVNFFDGLVENDEYGKLVPSLAKSIPTQVVNEETGEATYTFELKDNLFWSKWNSDHSQLVPAGKITAEDFVSAARLSLDPYYEQNDSSYLYMMFIKNAQKYYNFVYETKDVGGVKVPAHTHEEIKTYFDENVGVKAINETTIQYTLPKSMPYFPTVLTYSCYYPVATELYNRIVHQYGNTDDMNARDNIWYCGAFALNKYVRLNSIEYIKNPLYWDKDSVSLDRVHMNIVPQNVDYSWARKMFESESIDEFTVNEHDTIGWEKYVTGDGLNNIGNPVHSLSNARKQNGTGATFYFSYNFNRTLRNNSKLSDSQIDDFEKAIENTNFRKAILYATNKGVYNSRYNPSNPCGWNVNTFTTRNLAFDDNGKDYVDYFIEEFAMNENISLDEAKSMMDCGKQGVYNPDKAKKYLQRAVEELGDSVTYPIHFEIVEQDNGVHNEYYKKFEHYLQYDLDPSQQIIDVTTKLCSIDEMNDAFYFQDYSAAGYFGWSPDYGDPLTFLQSLSIGGELSPNFGLNKDENLENKILGEYSNLLNYADSLTSKEERYKAFAKAEYNILYKNALIIPMQEGEQGVKVSVTKVRPKTTPLATYGNSRDKLKNTVVYETPLNKKQFAYCIKKYEANKQNF